MARPLQANTISARPIQANPLGSAGPSYPAILNTALIWLDETTYIETGPNVTSWENKGTAGAAGDFNVVVGANDLTVVSLGSLNAVHANGASGLKTSAPLIIPQPYSVIATFQLDNISGPQYIYDVYDVGNVAKLFYGPALNGYRLNAGSVDLLTSFQGPGVISATSDAATGTLAIDGIGGLVNLESGMDDLDLGILFSSILVSQGELAIGDFILIPSHISVPDNDAVIAYLKAKRGL